MQTDRSSRGDRMRAAKWFCLCLLPWLMCACLTTKGTKKAPAFRGLSATEAEHLEAMNSPSPPGRQLRLDQEASPESLAESAEISLSQGDFDQSLYYYSKILSRNPERHEIRYKLGLALLLSGRLEEAKKELAEVLLHTPDMVEAHESLGIVHLKENRLEDAQREFRAALALDPGRFQARSLLGETFLKGNQYAQALTEFKAAAALAPNHARVLSNLGWTYFKMQNYPEALTWLHKARSQEPDNKRIHYRLGMVLAAMKRYPEALAAFRKSGDEAQALNNIGVHYYLEQRYGEAARCFQKALELRPTFYQEAKVNLEKALAKLQAESSLEVEAEPRKPGPLSRNDNSPFINSTSRD